MDSNKSFLIRKKISSLSSKRAFIKQLNYVFGWFIKKILFVTISGKTVIKIGFVLLAFINVCD